MDEVVIIEHDSNWAVLFAKEAALIRQILDPNSIARIEHFGSTSVPGLPAKPIVDLLVGINSLKQAKQKAIAPLESLGYSYWWNNPDKQRMFFVKGLPPNSPRTHHIHMVEADSPLWERLLFRDYLRQHSQEAKRYAALKYQLSRSFRYDREAYTQGKTEYIRSVMEKARKISD